MKLDEHTCKRLSVLSFREKVVFVSCIGVLLPFDTFEVISGSVNYYNHTVPGQSPRLSAHSFASTWSQKSFHDQSPQKKKVHDRRNHFTMMTNLHKSMLPNVRIEPATVSMPAQSSARPTEILRSVRERERVRERRRERVFFFVILVDPSRAFT